MALNQNPITSVVDYVKDRLTRELQKDEKRLGYVADWKTVEFHMTSGPLNDTISISVRGYYAE